MDALYAHFTEAPTKWHQAGVFYSSSSDPADRRFGGAQLFGGSVLIVIIQVMVLGALMGRSSKPSCSGNEQCHAGQWCMPIIGKTCKGYCEYCNDGGMFKSVVLYDGGPVRDGVDAGHRFSVSPWANSSTAYYATSAKLCKNASAGVYGAEYLRIRRGINNVDSISHVTDVGSASASELESMVANWCATCLGTADVNQFSEGQRMVENIGAMSKLGVPRVYPLRCR